MGEKKTAQVEGDQPVLFRLSSGDELLVRVGKGGALQVNATATRGALLVLPCSNTSIQIVTAHLPGELGKRKVHLLSAPTCKK